MDKPITQEEIDRHYESVRDFFLHMLNKTGDVKKYGKDKETDDKNVE